MLLNYIKKRDLQCFRPPDCGVNGTHRGGYDTTVQQNSCAHGEIFQRNSSNWELMYAVFTNSSRRGRRMLRRNTYQTRAITESTDPGSCFSSLAVTVSQERSLQSRCPLSVRHTLECPQVLTRPLDSGASHFMDPIRVYSEI